MEYVVGFVIGFVAFCVFAAVVVYHEREGGDQ